jgi:sugar lactone lactonase YvrE
MCDYVTRLKNDCWLKYLLALKKKMCVDGATTDFDKDNFNKLDILINDIKKYSNVDNSTDTVTETDNVVSVPFKNNTKICFEEVDQYVYNKPWNKLAPIHKIIKLREYVNNLLIHNDADRDELVKQLTDYVYEKKLTRSNDVKYDQTKSMIVSVPSLKYKDNKYHILL